MAFCYSFFDEKAGGQGGGRGAVDRAQMGDMKLPASRLQADADPRHDTLIATDMHI